MRFKAVLAEAPAKDASLCIFVFRTSNGKNIEWLKVVDAAPAAAQPQK